MRVLCSHFLNYSTMNFAECVNERNHLMIFLLVSLFILSVVIVLSCIIIGIICFIKEKKNILHLQTLQQKFQVAPKEVPAEVPAERIQDPPKQESQKNYPYEKKWLLTKTEYAFYNILKKKCDQRNIIICPKVRMEDFLNVTDKKNISKYRGYIKSRHIDFILCNKNLYLLAGLELDDYSHESPKARHIDEFKNNVFQTIQIPLFRVKIADGNYDLKIEQILNELQRRCDALWQEKTARSTKNL